MPDAAYQYRELFPLMIQSWRDDWGQGDFPFYWVQLADFMPRADRTGRQRLGRAARGPNDDARPAAQHGPGRDHRPRRGERHPSPQQADVGRRLARGRSPRHTIKAGPQQPALCFGANRGRFDLRHASATSTASCNVIDGKPVAGFAIAGWDRNWMPAQAEIISDNEVARPQRQRAANLSRSAMPGRLTRSATCSIRRNYR